MPPKKSPCPECGEDFDSPEQLDQHAQRDHQDQSQHEDDESPETSKRHRVG